MSLQLVFQLLLGLLTWVAPYLAFTSSTVEWFTRRQVLGGLLVSAVLGLLTGGAFARLGTDGAVAASGLGVCLLSERLIHSFVPGRRQKILLILVLAACYYGIGKLLGLWALCALLAIWVGFSLKDLARNRRKPQKSFVNAPEPATAPIEGDSAVRPAILPRKPNIYFLFLESLHSGRALEALYGHDDDGLAAFLKANGFTVFPHAHSNAYGTTYSLNTLLNMDSSVHGPLKQAPPAFQWLHANGYSLHLVDCSAYTFSHYVPWATTFNYAIPAWVKVLYARMLPFFLQSALLNRLTLNIDPFTAEADFKKVREDFLALPKTSAPAFFLLRFGAQHTLPGYTLGEREAFRPRYLELHRQAVDDVADIVRRIIAEDPGAVIVAMGDHGAASLNGAWFGAGDANANIRRQGFEPALVTEDLTGILLAVRFSGEFPVNPDAPLSPANIFRLVFQSCGVPPEKLPPPARDDTYFHSAASPHPFLLVRQGQVLENWIHYTPGEALGDLTQAWREAPFATPKEAVDIGDALAAAGRFSDALAARQKAVRQFGFRPGIGLRLAHHHLAMGNTREALALLAPHHTMTGEVLMGYALALAQDGSYAEARDILEQTGPALKLSREDMAAHRKRLARVAGDLETLGRLLRADALAEYTESWQKDVAVSDYLLYLSCVQQDAAALEFGLAFHAQNRNGERSIPHSLVATAAMALRCGRHDEAAELVRRALAASGTPRPATLCLWRAGLLEQSGDTGGARESFEAALEMYGATPWLRAQYGLFASRHGLRGPEVRQLRAEGEAYLAQCGRLKPLFDERRYLARYGALTARSPLTAFDHFLHFGRLLLLDPREEFNSAYYCLSNGDVFQAGHDPLWHFLGSSPYENRDPSLLFNVRAYMAQHPGTDWSRQNPLLHACLRDTPAGPHEGGSRATGQTTWRRNGVSFS